MIADVVVTRESDAAAAAATLRDAGFSVEHPPEDWLFKARAGDTVVDVLHRLNGVPVEEATLERAEQRDVLAIAMLVLPPTLVLIQKLRSPRRASLRLRVAATAVRAIRERLDWDVIKAQTADNDFAAAFLVLAGRLGLID